MIATRIATDEEYSAISERIINLVGLKNHHMLMEAAQKADPNGIGNFTIEALLDIERKCKMMIASICGSEMARISADMRSFGLMSPDEVLEFHKRLTELAEKFADFSGQDFSCKIIYNAKISPIGMPPSLMPEKIVGHRVYIATRGDTKHGCINGQKALSLQARVVDGYFYYENGIHFAHLDIHHNHKKGCPIFSSVDLPVGMSNQNQFWYTKGFKPTKEGFVTVSWICDVMQIST